MNLFQKFYDNKKNCKNNDIYNNYTNNLSYNVLYLFLII